MERLIKRAEQLGISLTEEQIRSFKLYYEMLIETNKVMNLTAITEIDDVITKHFIDSISLVKVFSELSQYEKEDKNDSIEPIRILDLGTGAGFPGIPLKIVFPKIEIILMDSLNKRVMFLQNVIQKLNMVNITAVHGRAEEMARKKEYREQFDLCVSRAVANLSTLSEYCIPFVKTGGCFISYKAADIEKETDNAKNAIKILGGNLTAVKKVILPDTDIERAFVIIDKKRATPKAYPRKAGTANKNPL